MILNNSKKTLLICNKESLNEFNYNKYKHVIVLNGEGKSKKNLTFLDRFIDKNSLLVRNIFLKKVNYLGKLKVYGKNIIEILALDSKRSAWWLSLIHEKSNFSKTPVLNKAIKLIALELIIDELNFDIILLMSNDYDYLISISKLCKYKNKNLIRKNLFFKKIFFYSIKNNLILFAKIIVNPFLSILFFINYIFKNRHFLFNDLSKWKNSKSKLIFFSYLNPKSPNNISTKYKDAFWGNLPQKLKEWKISSNWLHIEPSNSGFSSSIISYKHLKKINSINSKYNSNHFNLISFCDLKTLIISLYNFLKLTIKNFYFLIFINKKDENIYFIWHIFSQVWVESYFGKSFIVVLFQHFLFTKALKLLPKQKVGFYLQENINWQSSLIMNWDKNKHRKLIGINHSTLRFWDLRNFYYFQNKNDFKFKFPYPDFTAVNSKWGKKILLDGGIKSTKILDLEALRFQSAKVYDNTFITKLNLDKKKKNLIIFGAFNAYENKFQLLLINKIYKDISNYFNILYKPHPSGIKDKYIDFEYKDCTKSGVEEMLMVADVVYTESMTSTSVEAYQKNLPLIICFDSQSINLSPLYKIEGVNFVTNELDLLKHLKDNIDQKSKSKKNKNEEFFILDSSLPKWKKLIESNL